MNRTVLNTRNTFHASLLSFVVSIIMICITSLAQAEIVVIVSKDSNIDQASITEIGRLYLGKTGELANGSKFEPVDLGEGNSIRDDFYQIIANKTQLQLNAYWSRMIFTGKGRPPKAFRQESEVVSRISANARLVGYIDKSMLTDGVKVIAQIGD